MSHPLLKKAFKVVFLKDLYHNNTEKNSSKEPRPKKQGECNKYDRHDFMCKGKRRLRYILFQELNQHCEPTKACEQCSAFIIYLLDGFYFAMTFSFKCHKQFRPFGIAVIMEIKSPILFQSILKITLRVHSCLSFIAFFQELAKGSITIFHQLFPGFLCLLLLMKFPSMKCGDTSHWWPVPKTAPYFPVFYYQYEVRQFCNPFYAFCQSNTEPWNTFLLS